MSNEAREDRFDVMMNEPRESYAERQVREQERRESEWKYKDIKLEIVDGEMLAKYPECDEGHMGRFGGLEAVYGLKGAQIEKERSDLIDAFEQIYPFSTKATLEGANSRIDELLEGRDVSAGRRLSEAHKAWETIQEKSWEGKEVAVFDSDVAHCVLDKEGSLEQYDAFSKLVGEAVQEGVRKEIPFMLERVNYAEHWRGAESRCELASILIDKHENGWDGVDTFHWEERSGHTKSGRPETFDAEVNLRKARDFFVENGFGEEGKTYATKQEHRRSLERKKEQQEQGTDEPKKAKSKAPKTKSKSSGMEM